jgi:hypothetical protein
MYAQTVGFQQVEKQCRDKKDSPFKRTGYRYPNINSKSVTDLVARAKIIFWKKTGDILVIQPRVAVSEGHNVHL